MSRKPTHDQKVPSLASLASLARTKGVLRSRDLTARGFHSESIRRLCGQGVLVRTGRGLYISSKAALTENHSLAEAAHRVSHGVICLLTALKFHDLGTQNPPEVWMAIAPKARKPAADSPRLRIVRFSGEALSEGIEFHRIEGIDVRITSAAKTVADCFKYRNKIGLDVALEALRDGLRKRKFTRTELLRFAAICRVARVIMPYLQAME